MWDTQASKLFPSEYKYHDTNQTDKAREQKLRREAAVTVNYVKIRKEEESLNIENINLLVRFNKAREIFPSVTRVLSIILTAAASSASVERVNSKERVPKIPCSIPAASFAQRLDLYSNNPYNV